jgi:hypothetical protein
MRQRSEITPAPKKARHRGRSRRLVRVPRTLGVEARIKGPIFHAQSQPLSRSELHRQLGPTIRAWVVAACRWQTHAIYGQFRAVVFGFKPTRGTEVFVQFWSEPDEPLCCQVSSGRTDPPTRDWLGPDRPERIRAFGFEIGGDAENFERHLVLESSKDFGLIARSVIDILYAALDYRGLRPLRVELIAGIHIPVQRVFDSFTPARIIEAMNEHGQRLLGVTEDDEAPVLHFRRRGIDTAIELGARRTDTRSFRTAALTCELEPSADDVAHLTEVTGAIAPPGATPVVRLGTTLEFGGGVAIGWLHERIKDWNRMVSGYRREQRRKATTSGAVQPSQWVH